jgi:hypothetical protein
MKYDKKISLNENHKRSLTSTLMIVEQLFIEIKEAMKNRDSACCSELKNDVDNEIINENIKLIKEARKQICNLTEKYSTEKAVQSLQRLIDVKKTKIWEILCDSKAKKLKGFGEFPKEMIKEFDKDIDGLMAIVAKIEY